MLRKFCANLLGGTDGPVQMISSFGEFLRTCRLKAGIRTQLEAAKRVSELGNPVSQSTIAQYETGRVADPDASVLRRMAVVYCKDYMEFVYRLTHAKHSVEVGAMTEHERLVWRYWEGVFRMPMSSADDLSKPDTDTQLRAKSQMAESMVIVDTKYTAGWQADFPDLEVFWIVVREFLDDKDPAVLQAVVKNLQRGTQLVYFLPEKDTQPGARFHHLRLSLASEVGEELVREKVLCIPLDGTLDWLPSDLIIANPHRGRQAVGFGSIRQDGLPLYAVRLSEYDLGTVVPGLSRYICEKQRESYSRAYPPVRASHLRAVK